MSSIQGKPAECTLIFRPQDFNDHEAHIRDDAEHQKHIISYEMRDRQLSSLSALRTWAENTTCCRWRLLRQHWGEDDAENCGTCDVCVQPEPEEVQLGDVAILLLLAVQSATAHRQWERGANWQTIHRFSMRHTSAA